NEDWAMRYGGNWDCVQNLINASVVARDQQAQLDARARRMKVFVWGFAITSVLMCIAIIATFSAISDRKAAVRAQRAAEHATDEEPAARKEAERKQWEATAASEKLAADKKAADELISSLNQQLQGLKVEAAKAPANSAIRQSINNA